MAQHQTRNHASFGATVTWLVIAGHGSRRFPQTELVGSWVKFNTKRVNSVGVCLWKVQVWYISKILTITIDTVGDAAHNGFHEIVSRINALYNMLALSTAIWRSSQIIRTHDLSQSYHFTYFPFTTLFLPSLHLKTSQPALETPKTPSTDIYLNQKKTSHPICLWNVLSNIPSHVPWYHPLMKPPNWPHQGKSMPGQVCAGILW